MAGSEGSRPAAQFYDERLLIGAVVAVTAYIELSFFRANIADVVLGVFVLFVAPGYGFGAVLFGSRSGKLSGPTNLATVVGLSVVYNGTIGLLELTWGTGLNAVVIGIAAYFPLGLGTLFQIRRRSRGSLRGLARTLRQSMTFPGFSETQRRATWALLIGSLVAFAAIAYEGTVAPPSQHGFSLAAYGPDGTTNTLPSSGLANETLSLKLSVSSQGSALSAILSLVTTALGQNTTTTTTVPWSLPLSLAPGTTSSEPIPLASGSPEIVPVSFSFSRPGSYVLTFTFTSPGSADVASIVLTEVIA